MVRWWIAGLVFGLSGCVAGGDGAGTDAGGVAVADGGLGDAGAGAGAGFEDDEPTGVAVDRPLASVTDAESQALCEAWVDGVFTFIGPRPYCEFLVLMDAQTPGALFGDAAADTPAECEAQVDTCEPQVRALLEGRGA